MTHASACMEEDAKANDKNQASLPTIVAIEYHLTIRHNVATSKSGINNTLRTDVAIQ